jgi:hypothetical protein
MGVMLVVEPNRHVSHRQYWAMCKAHNAQNDGGTPALPGFSAQVCLMA